MARRGVPSEWFGIIPHCRHRSDRGAPRITAAAGEPEGRADLRFYEELGLLRSEPIPPGHRRYLRSAIRQVVFKGIGMTLDDGDRHRRLAASHGLVNPDIPRVSRVDHSRQTEVS